MKRVRINPVRRLLLAGLAVVAVAAVAVAAPAARAAAGEDAARLIDDLARETIATVADESLDRTARAEKLRDLLDRGFDGEAISRFVLGNHWRTASEAERREFVELFREFTALTYARRFEAYRGERLKILGTREQGTEEGQRKVLVQTELTRANGALVRLDWRVRETDGGWRIYDVVTEGVSMMLTQRSEFSAVIQQQGGVAGLLQKLRDRTARLEQVGSAG